MNKKLLIASVIAGAVNSGNAVAEPTSSVPFLPVSAVLQMHDQSPAQYLTYTVGLMEGLAMMSGKMMSDGEGPLFCAEQNVVQMLPDAFYGWMTNQPDVDPSAPALSIFYDMLWNDPRFQCPSQG